MRDGSGVVETMQTACDLFTAATVAFEQGDLASATAHLRQGFFENLYIAPLLQGEDFYPQDIWYASADAQPRAAKEYCERYGKLWRENPALVEFLCEVWNDPLVRAELTNFINLCKNLQMVRDDKVRASLFLERENFLNPERIKRTQAELLDRLGRARLELPVIRPRLALVMLAARDPAVSLEFYRNLLGVEPAATHPGSGGYAEFEFEGVQLAIHGRDNVGSGDPYGLGAPPASYGWGALFVFQVADAGLYLRNAVAASINVVDTNVAKSGAAPAGEAPFFVVRDPSGYLIEITEAAPRGLDSG